MKPKAKEYLMTKGLSENEISEFMDILFNKRPRNQNYQIAVKVIDKALEDFNVPAEDLFKITSNKKAKEAQHAICYVLRINQTCTQQTIADALKKNFPSIINNSVIRANDLMWADEGYKEKVNGLLKYLEEIKAA